MGGIYMDACETGYYQTSFEEEEIYSVGIEASVDQIYI